MAREFPLVRTYHNLVWNLRHLRPTGQRPPFQATRHPFCTNIQLQNASCAYWLKETSRDIGTKLVTQMADSTKLYKSQATKLASKQVSRLHQGANYKSYSASAACVADGEELRETKLSEDDVPPAEIEIVKLFAAGDYSQMYAKLKSYHEQGVTISTEIINDMAATVREELPMDTTEEYLHQSEVEVPMFHGKENLQYTSLYGRVYEHIETIYKVYKLYEPISLGNNRFVENYIWLCYHMDDLSSLQHLLYTYLKRDSYDSRTLSYVINAFVYNYDIEFAKTLIKSIIDMGKLLDESFLSSTIVSFVRVDAIFTNLVDLVDTWSASPNCESAYPKTVAMLLKQYYKYGTPSEIESIESVAEHLGYNNNFLVSMVKNQQRIAQRGTAHKKVIGKEDFEEILKIRNSIGHTKYALKAFYESYLVFFSKYSSMGMIQLILREMKKDGIPFTKFSYTVIVQHYISENKFHPLLKFMQKFVTKSTKFEIVYVKNLFDAFIRTYPFEGEYFAEEFEGWLKSSGLPLHTKQVLEHSCKITKIKSNITPVAILRPFFEDHKKYQSQWSPVGTFSKSSQTRDQIQFRVDTGIRDIMRKGIKPDYHVVENTFRKLNAAYRKSILTCLREMRMDRSLTRLEIFDFLLASPQKKALERFVKSKEGKLNTSDRLLLLRRLFNENSFDLASQLLENINEAELNDNRRMIKLNLSMRNNIAKNDFNACIDDIDTFPINDVTMSPYVYKQCQYIEKNLQRKIHALEAKGSDSVDVGAMNITLQKLKGLIGDIDARLKRDKVDIHEMVGELFGMLTTWIEATKNKDERKA